MRLRTSKEWMQSALAMGVYCAAILALYWYVLVGMYNSMFVY